MTGQLALDLGPIAVVEAHHRDVRLTRVFTPPLRRDRVWWRGRKRHIETVPVTLGGLL